MIMDGVMEKKEGIGDLLILHCSFFSSYLRRWMTVRKAAIGVPPIDMDHSPVPRDSGSAGHGE